MTIDFLGIQFGFYIMLSIIFWVILEIVYVLLKSDLVEEVSLRAIVTKISSNLLVHRPRICAIIFGFLIWFAAILIPDPNAPVTNAPWPHKWIHAYCNHALLWVHYDQAEDGGCHPGPESRAFMADLQMLATYPVYGIILNVIPYTYPVIAGFLVVTALPERIFTRRTSAVPDEPAKQAF